MSKLCTVCHKNEAIWDNYGGICGICMVEKEAKYNRVKHDYDLLDKFVTRLKNYFVIPHDVFVIEQMAEELKAEVSK